MTAPRYTYDECPTCKNIERKDHSDGRPARVPVLPFSVEHLGVAPQPDDAAPCDHERYASEIERLYARPWERCHVVPFGVETTAAILEEIAAMHSGAILATAHSAEAVNARPEIERCTGTTLALRLVPQSAIEEVRRSVDGEPGLLAAPIHVFHRVLTVGLRATVGADRIVTVTLDACEVDLETYLATQRPHIPERTKPAKRAAIEAAWGKREPLIRAAVAKPEAWRAFVDYWDLDWNYGSDDGGPPMFQSTWQSFRDPLRARGRGKAATPKDITFEAYVRYAEPGVYRVAAHAIDAFANEGMAFVDVVVE